MIFACFVMKTALKRCLNLINDTCALDHTPCRPILMIFEISALLKGQEQLCFRSQIALKLSVSPTTVVMIHLNRHINIIMQLFVID